MYTIDWQSVKSKTAEPKLQSSVNIRTPSALQTGCSVCALCLLHETDVLIIKTAAFINGRRKKSILNRK